MCRELVPRTITACRVAVASLRDVEVVVAEPSPVAEVTTVTESSDRVRLRLWHPSGEASEFAGDPQGSGLSWVIISAG